MNNDLISREALKKALDELFENGGYDSGLVMNLIDNAPTVDTKPFALFSFDKDELKRIVDEQVIKPIENGELVLKNEERPQGEWIEKVERRGCFAGDKTVYSYTCPFCGAKEFKKYPFCHCGADMRGGRE